MHQGNVGRGAAHVEGEDLFEAAAPRHRGSAHDSAGRSGKNGAHRLSCGRLQRGDAAAGLHDEHARTLCRTSFARNARLQAVQVGLHYGLEVGIHHDGAGALEFAELGQDDVRQRKRQAKLFENGSRRRAHSQD